MCFTHGVWYPRLCSLNCPSILLSKQEIKAIQCFIHWLCARYKLFLWLWLLWLWIYVTCIIKSEWYGISALCLNKRYIYIYYLTSSLIMNQSRQFFADWRSRELVTKQKLAHFTLHCAHRTACNADIIIFIDCRHGYQHTRFTCH